MNRSVTHRRHLLPLAAALASLVAAPAAARLVIESDDLRVRAPTTVRCGEPVALELEAESPALFAADSGHTQAVFDAARAVLGYECLDIPRYDVTGRLRGLDRVSYRATASAGGGWMLDTTHTVSGTDSVRAGTRRYRIRTLETGMDVRTALRRARREFGEQPDYDAGRRALSVERGGCNFARADDPEPGWYCLRARFTDGPDPRAYRLHYTQVVDQDQADTVRRQLVESFGAPRHDRQLRGGDQPVHALAWGSTVTVPRRDGDGPQRAELRARVRVGADVTVVTLDLLDGTLVEQSPQYRAQF